MKIFKNRFFQENIWYYIKGLYRRLDQHHAFLLSGGITFSLFTCILPLVLIVFSIVGVVLELAPVKNQIDFFIETLIPYQKTANSVKNIIYDRIEEFKAFKTISGIIGLAGILFAASGLFSSLRTVLNKIFKEYSDKHMVIGKLRDFGMTMVVLAFFLSSMAILPFLDVVIQFIDQFEFLKILYVRKMVLFIISVIVSLFSFLIVYIMFFLIYYLIPYAKLEFKVAALSAFWAAILWVIAKELFGYYIANSMTITRVYGTYIFIIATFFWVYYSSLVLIIAAEIGQLYWEKIQ